ncbi:hypothetical protein QBC37DRAFT_380306 [Rhypophila decipiens]|uniref:Zn(2)-C6 fungal-type domain-containing protein n=1 Tax=Rhypophila decipiens TaxID=261697 RepID=A0AAN7B287_9PEZI|nr:hypothetical protein QBC37DRAFT_380306 [Rhypophila decipiens]
MRKQQTNSRKQHTKSRNGCTTCKNRRVKCDEIKPSCHKCIKKNLICPGYGQRLNWSTVHKRYPTTPVQHKAGDSDPLGSAPLADPLIRAEVPTTAGGQVERLRAGGVDSKPEIVSRGNYSGIQYPPPSPRPPGSFPPEGYAQYLADFQERILPLYPLLTPDDLGHDQFRSLLDSDQPFPPIEGVKLSPSPGPSGIWLDILPAQDNESQWEGDKQEDSLTTGNEFQVHFPSYYNVSHLPYPQPNYTSIFSPTPEDMSQQYAQYPFYSQAPPDLIDYRSQVTPSHSSHAPHYAHGLPAVTHGGYASSTGPATVSLSLLATGVQEVGFNTKVDAVINPAQEKFKAGRALGASAEGWEVCMPSP